MTHMLRTLTLNTVLVISPRLLKRRNLHALTRFPTACGLLSPRVYCITVGGGDHGHLRVSDMTVGIHSNITHTTKYELLNITHTNTHYTL